MAARGGLPPGGEGEFPTEKFENLCGGLWGPTRVKIRGHRGAKPISFTIHRIQIGIDKKILL